MGYKYTEVNPYVWLELSMKSKISDYYNYIIVYVDNILHLAKDTKPAMNILNQAYILKGWIVGTPDIYLGENIEKVQLEYGCISWLTTCVSYLKGSTSNANDLLG